MFEKKLRGTQKRQWFYNLEFPKENLEYLINTQISKFLYKRLSVIFFSFLYRCRLL